MLNGTEPLKLLHLYGNLAIVVTTSNKLVAEPRQACMSPFSDACLHSATIMYMYICELLLSNQNFNGPYLEAEVVEEVIGWLGLVGTATANKFVATP